MWAEKGEEGIREENALGRAGKEGRLGVTGDGQGNGGAQDQVWKWTGEIARWP